MKNSQPRVSPIIWGALILVLCVWVTDKTFFGQSVAPAIWVTLIVLLVGAVLLGFGLAAVAKDKQAAVNDQHPGSPDEQ